MREWALQCIARLRQAIFPQLSNKLALLLATHADTDITVISVDSDILGASFVPLRGRHDGRVCTHGENWSDKVGTVPGNLCT